MRRSGTPYIRLTANPLGRRTVTVLTILNTALARVVRVVGHDGSEISLANRR
jgi:hypothetical protein